MTLTMRVISLSFNSNDVNGISTTSLIEAAAEQFLQRFNGAANRSDVIVVLTQVDDLSIIVTYIHTSLDKTLTSLMRTLNGCGWDFRVSR